MNKITALRTGKGRSKRVNIYLDSKFAFSLESEVALKEGLRVEQVLSTDRVKALAEADNNQRCFNAATLFLSYRPRSEPEIRERLRRRGFTDATVDNTISRLKDKGLVDDTAFAQFWKDNRDYFSPRSRSLTRLELKRKGVAAEIIDHVVDSIDDEDNAYRAGIKKARSLSRSDYQQFRRRLGDHLKRRGFSYGVINHTVSRLWQEQDQIIQQES
ncbi:regulatory protein RecX [Chloroflexota bacterium]